MYAHGRTGFSGRALKGNCPTQNLGRAVATGGAHARVQPVWRDHIDRKIHQRIWWVETCGDEYGSGVVYVRLLVHISDSRA